MKLIPESLEESQNFERGLSPEQIKRGLRDDKYFPGEILLNQRNDYGVYYSDVLMFIKVLPPDYADTIYFKVATLGLINNHGSEVLNYGSRFRMDSMNTKNNIDHDTQLFYPDPREEIMIKKYLNRPKVRQIKEKTGITPILNGKMLNESLDF